VKLVADANVLFSALIRRGLTRRLWFNPALELCSPRFVVAESVKHSRELREKYAGSEEEYSRLFGLLLRQVRLVSDDDLKPYLPAAASLSDDASDWLYLACALAEDAALWSNDKGFKKQGRVRVFSTAELAEAVGRL